jgi:hypothetical protein
MASLNRNSQREHHPHPQLQTAPLPYQSSVAPNAPDGDSDDPGRTTAPPDGTSDALGTPMARMLSGEKQPQTTSTDSTSAGEADETEKVPDMHDNHDDRYDDVFAGPLRRNWRPEELEPALKSIQASLAKQQAPKHTSYPPHRPVTRSISKHSPDLIRNRDQSKQTEERKKRTNDTIQNRRKSKQQTGATSKPN